MSKYLRNKYVGKYRVLAEYDQSTNDFIKNCDGKLPHEFDDYYIPCIGGGMIIHVWQDILQFYICKIRRGRSVLIHIKDDNTKIYSQIFDIVETDSELSFCFKSALMDDLEEYLKPKIIGANISPFSTKNLPKSHYVIPEDDLKQYHEVIKEKFTKDGSIVGHLIAKQTMDFLSKVKKIDGEKVNVMTMKKKACLNNREFIHKVGLWDNYILFLKKKGVN